MDQVVCMELKRKCEYLEEATICSKLGLARTDEISRVQINPLWGGNCEGRELRVNDIKLHINFKTKRRCHEDIHDCAHDYSCYVHFLHLISDVINNAFKKNGRRRRNLDTYIWGKNESV